jgi:hypothetical protein
MQLNIMEGLIQTPGQMQTDAVLDDGSLAEDTPDA